MTLGISLNSKIEICRSFNDQINKNSTYQTCSNNSDIELIEDETSGKILVEQGKYKVIDSSEGSLFTEVFDHFAIGVKGMNISEHSIIGLYNSSPTLLSSSLNELQNKMQKECFANSINYFILGGSVFSSLGQMRQAIELVNDYPIKGLRFNNSLDPTSSYHVVMTAIKVNFKCKEKIVNYI